MSLLTPVLFPFALVYDAVTRARNNLYDLGIRPSAAFDVPTIGVGNLAVGGTGKTPMVEYLIRQLRSEYRIATLSRGYGRDTRGVRIAGDQDTAQTIGDEPMQFYQKFNRDVVVAVGEERVFAVPYILDHAPDVNLVLLDDVFQHRRIKPALQILLTDFSRPFVDDFLLPAGRLRESRSGAQRADVVVVTKCPASMHDDDKVRLSSRIGRYTHAPVFFSSLRYGEARAVCGDVSDLPEKVVLVSGIANPSPLERYLKERCEVIDHIRFRDHHRYTRADLDRISDVAQKGGAGVVTTEKDFTKISDAVFKEREVSLFVVPIEMTFIKNGEDFNEIVRNRIRNHAL